MISSVEVPAPPLFQVGPTLLVQSSPIPSAESQARSPRGRRRGMLVELLQNPVKLVEVRILPQGSDLPVPVQLGGHRDVVNIDRVQGSAARRHRLSDDVLDVKAAGQYR